MLFSQASVPGLPWLATSNGSEKVCLNMSLNMHASVSSMCVHMCANVSSMCTHMHAVHTMAVEPLEATAGVCPMDGRVCVRNLHQQEGA